MPSVDALIEEFWASCGDVDGWVCRCFPLFKWPGGPFSNAGQIHIHLLYINMSIYIYVIFTDHVNLMNLMNLMNFMNLMNHMNHMNYVNYVIRIHMSYNV